MLNKYRISKPSLKRKSTNGVVRCVVFPVIAQVGLLTCTPLGEVVRGGS